MSEFDNLLKILEICEGVEDVQEEDQIAEIDNLKYILELCEDVEVVKEDEPNRNVSINHPSTSSSTSSSNQIGNGAHRFSIISETRKHVTRFNIMGRSVIFKMVDPPVGKNPINWFKRGMADVLNYVTRAIPVADYVGLILSTPKMQDGSAWISFRRMDQLHIDVVWEAISKILQSNAEIFADGEYHIEMTNVSMPVGTGGIKQRGLSYSEFCRRKYGIAEIINTDNLCLPRALVVGLSWVAKEQNYKKVENNSNNIQTERARELLVNANVNIPLGGAGIPEIVKLQKYLNGFNLVVYEFGAKPEVIFEGARDSDLPRTNLLHHNNHYSWKTYMCQYMPIVF